MNIDILQGSKNDNIAIAIKPLFIDKASNLNYKSVAPDFSEREKDFFVWSYKVIISNDSKYNLSLKKYDLYSISEDGMIRNVDKHAYKNNILTENTVVRAHSILESDEMIMLPYRSGIVYGQFIFVHKKTNKEFIIKISPISLDSDDSRMMAN